METWHTRDLPVLTAIVNLLQRHGRPTGPQEIAAEAGLSIDETMSALRWLDKAKPPYFRSVVPYATDTPARIVDLEERALREVGQWPREQAVGEALVRELKAAIAAEPDPVKRTKYQALLDAVSQIGAAVAGEVVVRATIGH